MAGVLDGDTKDAISRSKLLMVGAGGIGCELLKNLVLTGFSDIEIIDLDTIDVSNLNRQFLFHKKHVGKPKAKVAQESALRINPHAKITAHHDSIFNSTFGPDYFKEFSIVLNALDNHAARSHVNRLCWAANVPLIDSGTAGYMGQIDVFKKGLTGCYECQPHGGHKTYPGCTIRNTPSEFIHCIVWSKHLFNQLFGEADPDEDVSPDTADPEAVGNAGNEALAAENSTVGNVDRVSTRAWAAACQYDNQKLFHKLFHDDILYLLSMDRLWQTRRPPVPLDYNNLPDAVAGTSNDSNAGKMRDQLIWSIRECGDVYDKAVRTLKQDLDNEGASEFLVWDKDDEACLDFVTACANIRAHIFNIPRESRFNVKSMAGNIIPAIATTNAIIAGLIVMETLKVIHSQTKKLSSYFLNPSANSKGRYIIPGGLLRQNPKCYVCSPKPEIGLKIALDKFTVHNLEQKVLRGDLHMVSPDVEIEDGKGTILISSEEGETTENNEKKLEHFSIQNGTRLKCDDFQQNYQLVITIIKCDNLPDGKDFELVGDLSSLEAKPETENANGAEEPQPGPSSADDGDDLAIIDDDAPVNLKRRYQDPAVTSSSPAKRKRADSGDVEIIL